MRIFISHSSDDAEIVLQVAAILRSGCDEVFCFEERARADVGFAVTIGEALQRCDALVVFVGGRFSRWQQDEVGSMARHESLQVCTVLLKQPDGDYPKPHAVLEVLGSRPEVRLDPRAADAAETGAVAVARALHLAIDAGTPFNPHLFSYEKDIIAFYAQLAGQRAGRPNSDNGHNGADVSELPAAISDKLFGGCPSEWPSVPYWGRPTPDGDAYVTAAALSRYHHPVESTCMIRNGFVFPEARSRRDFGYFRPKVGGELRVAILVAGGIAPGINAVIDGVVQRHWLDATDNNYTVWTYGIQNGIASFDLGTEPGFIPANALVPLAPSEDAAAIVRAKGYLCRSTGGHARAGGSLIGTSRLDDLIKHRRLLDRVVQALVNQQIQLLYVIGGDGSMKLAHALWHRANEGGRHRLSVVGIPKTMDNDILWVWQSFGFLSAVEKARETLAILDTEIKSNPRLGILQLYGSDSGFVVSHTVAASGSDQCDVALIPEVDFSMRGLAAYLQKKMCRRRSLNPSASVPSGMVVMAETAIPTDAICYVSERSEVPDDLQDSWDEQLARTGFSPQDVAAISRSIALSVEEKEAIYSFHRTRQAKQRIQGQTSDALRSAGLKIVSRGLAALLVLPGSKAIAAMPQPDWRKLRIVTNEPRHLLRSIEPTCSDIIIGQRLGTLAVVNAMAGYTDFMISQWLTEFVLVPLRLVILGRKRIPPGMFWRSVRDTTGQPEDLDTYDIGQSVALTGSDFPDPAPVGN